MTVTSAPDATALQGQKSWDRPPHVTLWVVILNYNGLEDTLRCLSSLEPLTDPSTILVVDNASIVDPTPVLAERFPHVHVKRLNRNAGFAGGCNAGLHHALDNGADWILLLNNDTVVSPRLIDALREAVRHHERYAIFGVLVNWLDDPEQRMTDPLRFDPLSSGFWLPVFFPQVAASATGSPPVIDVDIVNGCCLMARRDVFHAIGMFDEQFFLQHEEADWCLRAKKAGFPAAVVNEVLVWHKGSASFGREGSDYLRYYDARNLWLLLKRHAKYATLGEMRKVWTNYIHYIHRMSAREKHLGKRTTAQAVIEGFADAVTGRFGPRPERTRAFVGALGALFELWTKAVWRRW